MSSFWSLWIIALVAINILGSWWLLQANRKIAKGEGATTGHEWAGIQELDNPLPYWWYLMFLGTLLFAILYLIFYPGLGNFKGLLGWSSTGQWEQEVARAEAKYQPIFDRYGQMSVEQLQSEPQALKMGQRLFATNCSVCHGSAATGSYGFPNLTDAEWIWGGQPQAIEASILHGRQAQMPAWGPALGDEAIKQVTEYVLQVSGRDADPQLAQAGAEVFASTCAACHGPDAKGNPALGSPNLTDAAWLYGGSRAEIAHSVRAGRQGQMPAFADQLGHERVRIVAAYVYSLNEASGQSSP